MKKNITLETKLVRNPDQLFGDIDGEIVILSIQMGEYYNLDRVGTDIWMYLSDPHSFKEIVDYLTEVYDVTPEVCKKDAKPFLEELLINNILLLHE